MDGWRKPERARGQPQGSAGHPVIVHFGDQPSDAELIGQAQVGRMDSFEELIRRYMPLATAFALSRTRISHEVDDIVQDAFVEVYACIRELQDPARFGAWLRGIVRHRSIDYHRKRVRRREVSGEFDPSAYEANQPIEVSQAERNLISAEIERGVLEALGQIREKYRMVLYLHLVAELPAREIAGRLGLTPGDVRIRQMRGLKILRKKLERAGIDARSLES